MFEQEIDGVQYVTVPKELWDKMWDVFEKIDKIGEAAVRSEIKELGVSDSAIEKIMNFIKKGNILFLNMHK